MALWCYEELLVSDCIQCSQGHGAEAAAAALRGRSPLLGALRQPRQQQHGDGWKEKASKVVAVRNVREEMSDLSAPVLSVHGCTGERKCCLLLGVCPAACGETEVLSGIENDVPL